MNSDEKLRREYADALQNLQAAKMRVAEIQDAMDELRQREADRREAERPGDLRRYLESQKRQQRERVERLRAAGIHPRA